MYQSIFKKRNLRVTMCGKRTKRSESGNRHGNSADSPGKDKRPRGGDDEGAEGEGDGSPKKKKKNVPENPNATNAMKRIKLKVSSQYTAHSAGCGFRLDWLCNANRQRTLYYLDCGHTCCAANIPVVCCCFIIMAIPLALFNLLFYRNMMQATNTRNKVLKARKQKKAVPGKKGKRLGGVVKRAMKAAGVKKKQG
jgi:hypothetical protein